MSKNALLLLSLLLLILSCQKEVVPSITINTTEFEVSDAASSQTISFEANMDWTAQSSDSWCIITKAKGSPSMKSINIAIVANDTYDDRSCSVTIMVDDLSRTVTINQKANLGVEVSVDHFNISNEESTIDIVVGANIEYDVTISDDWISSIDTRGLTSSKLSFNISKNESYSNRQGSIVITHKDGDLLKTIWVYQSQIDAIILSSKMLEISNESQTITVELQTNVDFEVMIPEAAESWVSYTPSRALRTETFLLNISGNRNPEVRSTEIYVKNRATTLQDTLTIIQEDGLSLPLIEGTNSNIQHIDVLKDFTFRLNDLDNKDVFFVFSNESEENPTSLPHLEGNVVSTRARTRFNIMPQQTFAVHGKPSITEFNNNSWKYAVEGIEKPKYQQYMASKPEKLELGSSEELNDDLGKPHLSTVRKVISAHGKNLYVWVADNCWGPSSSKTYHVTQEMVDAFAPKFLSPGEDNDIYEWVTNAAGEPWGEQIYSNLIPSETDDIHIWLTDIDDDNKTNGSLTLGYFYARDNFLKKTYKDSNEKLMFTIDAVIFAKTTNGTWDVSHYWPMQATSTLAHEFTHMIYYYQKNIVKKQLSNTAINEMSAQCMEDLVANKILANGPRGVAYTIADAGKINNTAGRLPLFNSNNDYNLLNWSKNESERLLNYAKTYALGAYLMRNFGGANFIRELIQNNSTGVESIVNAVNMNGGSNLTYGDILQKFGVATLLSNTKEMETGYKYNTEGWSQSKVNGITYELGAINLFNYSPNPYIYDKLPETQSPGSNMYYRAGSNLSGTKEWHFEGMSTDTKLTVVIK